ncbi:hypothetical protein C8A05DRAFT_29757 [Staphylotrichum tortipilum]|uniref:Cyanovirin-N domain-containing protein n=1 Tax=Staphylotrichum tortipilum TaxID=2831512 RepID=A0AAN6MSS2_9PEZI|nr:hypothetical protein C8A05DRAFT_29757 [Staphylotrichum longicolle]
MGSIFFTAVALALGAAAAPAVDFAGSCEPNSIKISSTTVQANCKNIFGQYACSKLDLNRCIKNNYGRLAADPTGAGPHFGDQCVKCTNTKPDSGLVVDGGPSLMYCACNPGTGVAQGSWPTAIIDLNTVIDNNNGLMECYGVKGTAC